VKKGIVSVLSASMIMGATSLAFAGAYGEAPEAEEMPQAVAAAPMAEPEPAPTGYWYVGVGGIYSIENFHCDADDAWGYNVRAGRRINRWVAVEAEWEHPVDDFDDADKVDGFGRLDGDIEVWNVTANARVYPLDGRWQPYILIGGGYGEADLPHDDNDGFVGRFGLGLDFLITDKFGVTTGVDYVVGTDDLGDYDQIPVSVGIFYNFI
jgi:opacity protein-like surface antigen